MIIQCLFVGIGGFIASVLRYILGKNIILDIDFPLGTLLINFIGSLVIGIIFAISQKYNINQNFLLFLKVGVCGGFTTFSTFSLETMELLSKGKILLGVGNAVISVVVCVCAVAVGEWLAYVIKA